MSRAQRLADTGNDQMTKDFVLNPVEAYAVVDLVQNLLGTVENDG